MRFTKMHGIGNDYIYVNAFEETIEDPSQMAIKVSDRHFGVGSDGLVLIGPSDVADFQMRMFNNDGSEGEMCGNASRCIARYVYERGLTNKETVTLETRAGIKVLEMHVENGRVTAVRVDMGEPVLKPADVPVLLPGERVVNVPVMVDDHSFRITAVSMGNPHCVLFVDDIFDCGFEHWGPILEKHPLFPAKANIEFVQVIDRTHIRMRVWERGSGETMACGTGACATLVACVLNGVADRTAELQLRGGNLQITWAEDGHVYQQGPAAFVCDGVWLG